MTFDEETFLTAYVDGELPPGPREGVESALASDPRLADDLRALTTVRDLVSGLSRPPAPRDVSAEVLARLGRRPAGGLSFGVLARLPAVRVAGRAAAALATAAAVVAAVAVGLLRPAPATGPGARPGAGLARVPADAVLPWPFPGEPGDVQVPTAAPAGLASGEEPSRAESARNLRRLFDAPYVHKVFVVSDALGDADGKVGAVFERTPRRRADFGRMTVVQDVVVDPEHPGRASVYIAVVDDRELAELYDRVRQALPASTVTEAGPRPELFARLADAGPLAVLSGTPVAELVDSKVLPRAPAIRSLPAKDQQGKRLLFPGGDGSDPLSDPGRYRDAEVADTDAGPTLERMRSGPHPSLRALARVEGAAPREPGDSRPAATPAPPPRDAARATPRLNLMVVLVPPPRDRGGP